MIGFCPYECGQEGVVYVDDVIGIGLDHLIADNLHIASQYDEIHFFLAEHGHLLGFHLRLVGVIFLDGPYIIRYVKLLGDVTQVLVIAHDTRDVHVPFSSLISSQQVIETVAHLADENGHAGLDVAEIQMEIYLVTLSVERFDVFLYLFAGDGESFQFPFQSHEKHFVLVIHVLV